MEDEILEGQEPVVETPVVETPAEPMIDEATFDKLAAERGYAKPVAQAPTPPVATGDPYADYHAAIKDAELNYQHDRVAALRTNLAVKMAVDEVRKEFSPLIASSAVESMARDILPTADAYEAGYIKERLAKLDAGSLAAIKGNAEFKQLMADAARGGAKRPASIPNHEPAGGGNRKSVPRPTDDKHLSHISQETWDEMVRDGLVEAER